MRLITKYFDVVFRYETWHDFLAKLGVPITKKLWCAWTRTMYGLYICKSLRAPLPNIMLKEITWRRIRKTRNYEMKVWSLQLWLRLKHNIHMFHSFHGYDEFNKLACSQRMGFHSSVGGALQRYRRGHGFESRWSPENIFRAYFAIA